MDEPPTLNRRSRLLGEFLLNAGDSLATLARVKRLNKRGTFGAIVCWTLLSTSLPFLAQVKTNTSEHQAKPSDHWVLRNDGIGPVDVGMDITRLNAVLGEDFSMPNSKDDQSCFYLEPKKYPHVAFTMIKGRVARIDVDGPGIQTAGGIQVGDTEAKVLKVYGRAVKIEPHFYDGPEGHYLTIHSKDGRYGVRFESYKGKIETFYAGRADAIQYVEGCE